MNDKRTPRDPSTVDHPVAGPSTVDRTKIAIRWVDGVTDEHQKALLEELDLELFTTEVNLRESSEGAEEKPAPKTGSGGGPGARPRAEVNQTHGLWWVARRGGGVVRKETLRQLESSDHIQWIAPALRAGRGSDELASGFCVNPTRFYVTEAALPYLEDLDAENLQATVDPRRTARLKGLVALDVVAPSVAENRTALEVAEAIRERLENSADLSPADRRIRFENIPLISPACRALPCRATPTAVVPDDPMWPGQWGVQRIQANHAWNLSRGDPDVVVAVIDEGVELGHPDLTLHPQSWNASSDTPDGSPVGNHGTPCAGLVAAVMDNTLGVAGVASRCRVMAIATATWADMDIAEGLYFAADNGARVVSMSFGVYPSWGFWDFDIIRDALQYALDRDLVLIAASGNENGAQARFPGSDTRTLCVGGSNRDDLRKSVGDGSSESWWGASYGPDVDVVAPCLENPSTDRLGAAGYTPNDFMPDFNGTSSATPITAGVAALVRSLRPDLPNETVREILERTCDKVNPGTYVYDLVPGKPNGAWNEEMGYGRINAERALQVACAHGRDHGEECEDLDLCLERTPRHCRSPEAPPWRSHDHCIRWYEPRVVAVDADRQIRCQFRVVIEHCLRLLGRQQGPLLYTTTLLPGETVQLYHYDRYRRVRSATQRVSIHSSLRQTVGALWEARRTQRTGVYRDILETTREESDTGALVGGMLGGPLGAAIGSLFDKDETSVTGRTTIRLEDVSSEFSRIVTTATQQVETEHSLVVSTYEDREERDITARTLVNRNDCYAVTYFVRRVYEAYRLISRVVRVEWRCVEGQGFGPWRPVHDLDEKLRRLLEPYFRDLPAEGEVVESPREITVPTEGALYEAELAHCSSCEPARELATKIELARAAAEARRADLDLDRLQLEIDRRRALLTRGELEPFHRLPDPFAAGHRLPDGQARRDDA